MEPTEDISEALSNSTHQQDSPPTPKNRYGLWALLGLVAVVALAWDWIPLPDAAKRIQSLPLNGPGFTGQELDWTEAEKSVLKGANAVKRLYRVGETSFVLTAIDGELLNIINKGVWQYLSLKDFPGLISLKDVVPRPIPSLLDVLSQNTLI